jgi:SAM-dependent methyltransferase
MQASEYGDMFRHEDQLWWYRGLRGFLGDVLQAHSTPGGVLLDAGCGTGRNLCHYRDLGYRVIGLDLSQAALDFSRRRVDAPLILGSVTDLPIAPSSADVVSSMDVIYMLGGMEPAQSLASSLRILRPGGLLIIHVCALEWLRSQHDDVVAVQHRYTRSELHGCIEAAGRSAGIASRIERSGYRVGLLFPLVTAVKLAKKFQSALGSVSKSDQGLTPGLLNGPLTWVMKVENWLLRIGVPMPIGSSVFAVVRRLH